MPSSYVAVRVAVCVALIQKPCCGSRSHCNTLQIVLQHVLQYVLQCVLHSFISLVVGADPTATCCSSYLIICRWHASFIWEWHALFIWECHAIFIWECRVSFIWAFYASFIWDSLVRHNPSRFLWLGTWRDKPHSYEDDIPNHIRVIGLVYMRVICLIHMRMTCLIDIWLSMWSDMPPSCENDMPHA